MSVDNWLTTMLLTLGMSIYHAGEVHGNDRDGTYWQRLVVHVIGAALIWVAVARLAA